MSFCVSIQRKWFASNSQGWLCVVFFVLFLPEEKNDQLWCVNFQFSDMLRFWTLPIGLMLNYHRTVSVVSFGLFKVSFILIYFILFFCSVRVDQLDWSWCSNHTNQQMSVFPWNSSWTATSPPIPQPFYLFWFLPNARQKWKCLKLF